MEKRKILIVEDDAMFREMLMDMLSREYECIQMENGLQAMEWMEANPNQISLVLTDLVMPQMDGFELLQYIQNSYSGMSVQTMAVTAYDENELIQRALGLGVQEVILKPFEPEVVKRRVKNMMILNDKQSLHNVMEDIIKIEIDKNIASLGICKCPICKRDLLTLALNRIKPRYVSSQKGAVLTKANNNFSPSAQIEMVAELARCAEIVKKQPHH